MAETAAVVLVTFFATIGPFDVAAMFAVLTAANTKQYPRLMTIRNAVIARVVLLMLALFGNALLPNMEISLAASHGQLQLNTYRAGITHNVMECIELLSDATVSFTEYCGRGFTLNEDQIAQNMAGNFPAITVLAPRLGYGVTS